MQVTEPLIKLCLAELTQQAAAMQRYKDYYEGRHEILTSYAMQDSRANRKLIFNFPRKFVDNETGYLLGKPVNYVSKSDDGEIIACIDRNTAHWDKEHDINLRKHSEIYGEAYELDFVNTEGEFSATYLTPLECYVLVDGSADKTVLLALHCFTRQFDDTEYLDVYTDAEILHFSIDGEALKPLGKHTHIFERVPVIVCPANSERKSGFEDVVSLFDAYDAINSDLANEIADHRNAYLIIENAKIEEGDLAKMKSMGIIQVPKGGKVSWLIKDINDSFVQNELNNIERKIYDMMDEVNFNENWAANTSLTLTVTGGSSPTLTGTLKKGDYMIIGTAKYLITKNATAADDEIAVEFTPGLAANLLTTTEITVGANYTANLAFHRNAFALVSRPLALPKGLGETQKSVVNYDGFGLRVIYDYNSQYKKDVVSIDMLCGVKTLDPKLACKLLG